MPSSASLDNHPLAFSTDDTCVSATSRIPFTTSDGILLNIEVFDYTTTNSQPDSNHHGPLLLFLHGICESAETKGVQAVVSAAKSNGVRVAVLELEGHGLSEGRRGVCTNFDRLVSHVLEFVRHAVTSLGGEDGVVPYAISGSSLGGVLSLYAAQEISQCSALKDESLYPGRFVGVAPIAPAVGVDPRAVPSAPIVTLLKFISFLCPAAALPLTPLEDPIHYNCPKSTMRNYSGHWALGTSKMLLDVTSSRVKKDLKEKLTLKNVPSLLLLTGSDDEIVPKEAVEIFFKSVEPVEKRFEIVPDAGHDILFVKRTSDQVVKYLFQWLALVCQ